MGSKNRVYLGIVSSHILHKVRNVFSKKVYMTDATIKKVEEKHPPLDKEFLHNGNFQIIIDNTLMIYFDEKKNLYNCLSKVDNKFFVYGMISKNNRTEVSTLFKTNPSQIKKNFKLNENLIVIKEDYISK